MWEIETRKAEIPFERIASLLLDSPINSHSDNEIGLLVELWCGRQRVMHSIEHSKNLIEFGLTRVEVVVDLSSGRISSENRLKKEFINKEVALEGKKETNKGWSIKGVLKSGIGSAKGKNYIGIDTSLDKGALESASEKSSLNYETKIWRVADSGYNYWSVFGVGLNEYDVLENRVLGDELLCFIRPGNGARKQKINVSLRCRHDDIWLRSLDVDGDFGARDESRVHKNINRDKITKLLIFKELEEICDNADTETRLITLASQLMQYSR